MYVTRPLSMYQKDPSMLSLPPPEGPNSGILIIQDEESGPAVYFGSFKGHELKNLPFPQNKNLKLCYPHTNSAGVGERRNYFSYFHTAFIPVLNQPLSSNLYYAISSQGTTKGQAYTSSTEGMGSCCFCSYVRDVAPQPLNPNNTLQQFQVECKGKFGQSGGFVANAIAADAFPPTFLGRKGWKISTSTPSDFHLHEAQGLNSALRARLPDFNVIVVVGKWYCPFLFVKEGSLSLEDQMSSTMFYEMTLEQKWEEIYTCDMVKSEESNVVAVDVTVETEFVTIAENVEVTNEEKDVADGVMWYRGFNQVGEETSVGLSLSILERMKWEMQMFGWDGGIERKVRVKKVEKFEGREWWKRFGCYVLVERFVLKKTDESLVLTYGFRHTNHIRCKWM